MTERAGAAALARRYALALACVGAAVLLRVSPLGSFFYPTEPFIIAVVAAAWFGGAGPGVFAALLSALTVPQLIALTQLPATEYRLLWGFFDVPRFITLGLTGAAVGWGASSLRRAQAALRERERQMSKAREELEAAVAERTEHLAASEGRYARAMEATEAGHWEWDLVTHQVYHSPRFRELYGVPLDEKFTDRDAWKARQPIPPGERARQEEALRASIADPAKPYDIEISFEVRPGEVRWVRSRGKVFRDENGRPLRISGATTDITAQKLAQEALRQSEERYERVVLAADAGVWDWDVASDKFYVSPKLLEIAGFAPGATFSGREDFMRRAPFHPEDRDKYRQEVKQLFASGGSHLTTEVRSVLDGETVWNRLDGICFRDPAGRVVRWTGSVTDITERKRAEEALRESEQRYARVMQASEDGFWEWIVASDQFYASPRMLAIYGLPPDTVFRGRADFLARFPFHAKDLRLWRASVAAHLAGVTARIDIEIRAKVRGEMRWLQLTGICQRDASGAEERWTGSVSDITARRHAQEALRRSEERYARAMEGSDAGHWDWNIVSDEMFVSERAREMLALPAGALPARRSQIMDLVPMHPEDRAAMAEAVKTGIRSGVHERDYRVIPRPGEMRWLRTRAKVYKDARGAAMRMTGSIIDITERKLAAEALRLSEQRYARAMDAAEAGHWEWNVATDEMFVSARQREMLELPAQLHFANREAYLAAIPFHPEDRERFIAVAKRHIDEAWPRFEQEFRVVVKGETRWMRLSGKSHPGADGKAAHFTGSLTDITEAKLAEDALRASEERYSVAMAASEEGHYDLNIDTGGLFISERLNQIFGFPPGSRFANRAEYLERLRLHPNDTQMYHAELDAAVAKDGPERYEFEFRILHPSGGVRWLRTRGKVTRDAEGRARRRTGVIADITEAKLAEEALLLSQERYALAMRASDAGHWDWKIAQDEFYASPRYLEFGGFPPDMQYSKRDDIVSRIPFHPDDRPAYEAAVLAHFAGETPRLDVVVRVVPHGQTRWLHVIGICLRDEDGKPARWAGSVADITERKRAEALLAGEKQLLEMMAHAKPLAEVLDALCRIVEENLSGCLCGISLVDATGTRLVNGAAPSLPHGYLQAIDDKPMERDAGPCCTAAVLSEQVISTDVATEKRWVEPGWCALALSHGLRSIWSTPIVSSTKKALGTFAIYFTQPASPTDEHLAIIERFSHVAAVAIERAHAEEALRVSEERYALAMEASEEGHFDWNVRSDEIFASARMKQLLGLPADGEFRTRNDMVAVVRYHPGDRERLVEMTRQVLASSALQNEFEYRILRGDEVHWLRASWKIFRDAAGAALRVIGVLTDITERKLAEGELRESEARFRVLTELSSDWYWEQDANLRFTFLSGQVAQLTGYSRDSSLGKTRWEIENMTPLTSSWPEHQAVLAARKPFRDLECRRVGADGTVRYLSMSGAPVFDAQGVFRGYQGIGRNITERKRIEEELRSRQEMLQLALKSARAVPWQWINGADPQLNRWSPELAAMFGVHPDAFDGTAAGWWKFCHADDVPKIKASIVQTLATGEIDVEYRVAHPDGRVHWLNQKGRAFFDANGKPVRSIGFMFDITERRKVEDDLRSRQEMLELAQKSARAIAFEWKIGATGEGENRWSADLEAMYGFAPGTYDGTFETWKKLVHPDDWPRVREAVKHAQRTGDVASEYRVVHRDGSVHWLQARGRMFFGASGEPVRMVGFMQDVTQRKQAENDVRQLEQKLRRAQRLEAMGTLAGGIAHDFNNILGAIVGYGEMALRDAKKGTRLRRDLDAIMAAGERGRSLVDRILAFSRSGVGERVPVHVEEVVREALDQLAAKLPENVTIAPRLRAERAAMLGDSTQVHQVVMNLASNAVQAMPKGGLLRVSLESVAVSAPRAALIGSLSAGEYLVLKVADTGTGIAPDVLERMFDPFFTTKEVGVGSGLGLSLVHGIVANVGGAIDVVTELGKGSTFTVYLPRSGDAPLKESDESRPLPRGEGQRVLVVDDEEPLVRLATETLERLGYSAVGFTSSAAALAAFRADPQRFDAVLTDERMPGMSGTTLIREVRGIRDAIPVVLMSGYLGMHSVEANVVVRKPLSARDLAASMARVLHP